jgi:hypothetical protein
MNLMLTYIRPTDESSTILSKTYTEEIRGVERIDWQPHHICFYFVDGNLFAVKADRIIEIITVKD